MKPFPGVNVIVVLWNQQLSYSVCYSACVFLQLVMAGNEVVVTSHERCCCRWTCRDQLSTCSLSKASASA